MNNLEMAIACLYALMVAISYNRAGLIAALFWPVTIVLLGLVVYVRIITSDLPQSPPKE